MKESFPVIGDGDDGVVKCRSAHLDGAASELVVRSPHSTQANPHTVQEVRRILHVHGEALDEAGLRCGVAAQQPETLREPKKPRTRRVPAKAKSR